jgi:hypothetical protein
MNVSMNELLEETVLCLTAEEKVPTIELHFKFSAFSDLSNNKDPEQ